MNSISWGAAFDLEDAAYSVHASEPREGVSPTRYVTVAPLRHKATGIKVAAINCHFISSPHLSAWRTTQWLNNRSVLAEVISDVTADGYVPLVGCDINKAWWDLIPGLTEPRYRTGRPTVDRIGVPAGVKATARLGTNGGSNHQPVIATLSITKE